MLCKNDLFSWSCAVCCSDKVAVSPYYIRGAHLQICLGTVFLPSAPLFSPILTFFFLAGLSGNITPKKQPPLGGCFKELLHTGTAFLQLSSRSIKNSVLIAALNR